MKSRNLLRWSATLFLSLVIAHAQETIDSEKLSRQLKQLQETFEKQQREMRENFERLMREQQTQIDALKKQLEAARSPAGSSPGTPPVASRPALVKPAPDVAAAPAPAPTSAAPDKKWSPADPIPLVGRSGSYLNLSLDGLFAAGSSTAADVDKLQPGGHDPNQRGFTLQNLEATFDGAVDPYLRGQANLVFQIDAQGASAVEVEEAYLESLALPGNLQVRAGQFFTEFGRLNPTHPHTWTFLDQPLVNSRLFGPDGLRNPGARLSWLAPTPFYSELFLTVQNSQGETTHSFRNDNEGALLFGRPTSQTSVKSFGDLLIVPRHALSFDLTDTQTLLLGASAAFGPNGSGPSQDTRIYGLDTFWKWKPANAHGGFPFVSWQTEAMLRRYEAAAYDGSAALLHPPDPDPALPAETLTDYGFYSQVAYGFRKGWVAALRGDYVNGDQRVFSPDPDRDPRWRVSPNLTWYPSEFSKLRLQYNYDDRRQLGVDHSVWFQFEFLLGAHAAHKF